MMHHPHVHMIVPGGGLSVEGDRWITCRKNFFLPVRVLAKLSRYTHRVAISNRRLIRADAKTVTFKVKDYRLKGRRRHATMTLATSEFIRRFLIHVLPKGLH